MGEGKALPPGSKGRRGFGREKTTLVETSTPRMLMGFRLQNERTSVDHRLVVDIASIQRPLASI
eukprot:6816540-Pyramimonas_sp.AAC.1